MPGETARKVLAATAPTLVVIGQVADAEGLSVITDATGSGDVGISMDRKHLFDCTVASSEERASKTRVILWV